MSKFTYKELDSQGRKTLDVLAGADKFNKWIYQTIKPFCHGKILEIGSGIGNISKFFVGQNSDLTLSDIRVNYCAVLRKNFPEKEVLPMDLTHPDFEAVYKSHLNKYDSVFALNVVEHIKDDELAIRNCHKLLKSAGKLIILVPAYQRLYNRFDKELEHFRRYTKKTLNHIFENNQFTVLHDQYFNFMGIPGWYISGKIMRNKTIPKNQMAFYNKLVPVFKLVDKCVLNRIGLSVISVGIKK